MSQPEQGPDTPQSPMLWPAERHAAYLDSRPDAASPYNPAAEYGDPDWREPASDVEAAARTAWLAENTPPAAGWPTRPLTPVEAALQDAQERALHSDRAHDSDPYAWAEYQRLQALDRLGPLTAHDALDDLPHDEHGRPDTLAASSGWSEWHDDDQIAREHRVDEAAFDSGVACDPADYTFDDRGGPFTDTQGRWWPSTGAWAAGTCDPSRGTDGGHLEAPDDPDRLRQRIDNVRNSLAEGARQSGPDEEQRREQLTRWHDDDHGRADIGDRGDGSGDGHGGELGWGR